MGLALLKQHSLGAALLALEAQWEQDTFLSAKEFLATQQQSATVARKLIKTNKETVFLIIWFMID